MQGQQRKGKHQLHQTSVSFKDVIEKKVREGGRDAYALLLCLNNSLSVSISLFVFLHSLRPRNLVLYFYH